MDKLAITTPNSDDEPTKPPYEPPVVVKLGEIGAGAGQGLDCTTGTGALGCAAGSTAAGCGAGSQGGTAP